LSEDRKYGKKFVYTCAFLMEKERRGEERRGEERRGEEKDIGCLNASPMGKD
jgi:hypothetical protein